MTTTTADTTTAAKSGARLWLWIAVAAFVTKLPQAIATVLPSDSHPTSQSALIALVWLVSTIALLAARRWVGLLSGAWLAVLSGISGVRLLMDGHALWGGFQIITAVVALVALILALLRGAFSGSRW